MLLFIYSVSKLSVRSSQTCTQFSGVVNKNNETNVFIESDITDRLKIVTKRLETTQLVLGFMLDNKKQDLLN